MNDRTLTDRTLPSSHSLHKNLTEHINSEIALRSESFYFQSLFSRLTELPSSAITDRETALRFLHSTFLYVRITKNPTYYAIANSATLSPDARLEEICVEAIKQLVSEGIVVEEEDASLAPNEYGEVMSRFYISHPTFVALKSMSNGVNMRILLETLAKAEEFSSFRIRQGEKSVRDFLILCSSFLPPIDTRQACRFSPRSTR